MPRYQVMYYVSGSLLKPNMTFPGDRQVVWDYLAERAETDPGRIVFLTVDGSTDIF